MIKCHKRYENCTFDNFNGSKELTEILRKPKEIKQNIIITGGVGTGKTHLAYALLNQECTIKETKIGKYYFSNFIRYNSVKKICDIIRDCWKTTDRYMVEIKNELKTIPLLIIDEIGVQYGTDSERIELFEVIDARYNEMLPTIIISNLPPDGIMKVLGARITDRLFGGASFHELTGGSHR